MFKPKPLILVMLSATLKRMVCLRGIALSVFILLSVLSAGVATLTTLLNPAKTVAATQNTINFQARLQSNTGALVPDGYYNIQFKLYDAASAGTNLWTESYLDVDGSSGTTADDYRVQVKNGYLSVALGTRTAFPGTINWDQQLWLTMNIGGTNVTATPTYDGEMSPRLALTAVPYAFKAGQLAKQTGANNSTLDFATQTGSRNILLPDESGTLCIQSSTNCGFALSTGSGNYIQNTTSPQASSNFNISGTGVAGTSLTAAGSVLNGTSLTFGAASAASIQSASGQSLTVTGSSSLTLLSTTTSALTLDSGTTGAINIGTNANAKTITIGNQTGAAAVTIDSGTGTIGIGAGAQARTINLGTGAAVQTIHIGDGAAANVVTLGSGTGAATTTIKGGNTASAILVQAASGGTIGIANNAVAQTVAIGNITGASGLTERVGTGNYSLDGVAGSTYTIGASTTTGTITLGGTAQTGTMTLGSSSGTNTLNIANGAGTTTLNLANVQTAGSVSVGNGMTTGTISLGGASQSGTLTLGKATVSNTINIGAGATATANTQTINIGTGAATGTAADVVNIGSTNGASSTTIKGGTGNVNLQTNAANSGTIVKTNTNSTTAFQVQNGTGASVLTVDTATTPNLLTNPGFETGVTGWSLRGSATIAQNTTLTNTYMGAASLQVTTGTVANNGGSTNSFTQTVAAGTYTLSFYLKLASGSLSTLRAGYNQGAGDVTCALNSSTVAAVSGFQRYSCTFTSTANLSSIFIDQGANTTSLTMYVDAVQLQSGSNATPYNIGAIQLRGVVTTPVSLQNISDSATAFQVQNSAGTNNLLVADTLNGRVTIGGALTVSGGINNNNGGITNAGAISGITTLSGSGNITSTGGVLSMQGTGNNYFAGNVGIGTATPGTALDIVSSVSGTLISRIYNSNAAGYGELKIQSDASSYSLGTGGSSTGDAGSLYVYDYSTGLYRLRIASNGNVGIGTTGTAAYKLDVNGDVNVASGSAYKINGINICTASGCTPAAGSSNYIQNGTSPQAADFNVTGSGVVGGRLGVGATSGSSKLYVSDSTSASSAYAIDSVLTSSGANAFVNATRTALNDTATTASTTSSKYAGNFIYNKNGSAADTGYSAGAGGFNANINSGSVVDLWNVSSRIQPASGTSITRAYDFVADAQYGAAGSVGSRAGLNVRDFNTAAGQSLTNQYGILIDNLYSGTNNYSIYTGTAQSYFGGNVTTVGALTASGSASISGGLNNNSGGITNAGTIAGVTTISGAGNVTVQAAGTSTLLLDTVGAGTVTLGTAATTINLGGGTASETINLGNSTGNDTVNIATGTGTDVVNIGSSSANTTSTNIYGNTLVKTPGTNSTTAFQVQNASSNTVLGVDTSNARILVGGGSTSYFPKLYFGDPGATLNNAWIGEFGGTDSDKLQAQGRTGITLSTGNSATAVFKLDSTGNATFQNGTDNAAAFQIQSVGGAVVLNADTVNNRVSLSNLDAVSGVGAPASIGRTQRVNINSADGFGTGTFNAGSPFTPATGSVLVATIGAGENCSAGAFNSTASQLTVSGGGLTWVAIGGSSRSVVPVSNCDTGIRSYYAVVGTPASTTIAVSASGLNIYGYNVEVSEYTNVDTTTPITGAVFSSRASADNDTWTATLGATPVAGDYKIGVASTASQDAGSFGTTGYATPSGWTTFGAQNTTFGSASQENYQTGSTSTTVNFAVADLNYASQDFAYGGFILKQNTTPVSNLTIGGSVASGVIVKPSSNFQVQSASSSAILSVDTTTNAIQLNGVVSGIQGLNGSVYADNRSVTTSATYTAATQALGYYFSANSGTTNSALTSTFNITGLPNSEGTMAFINARAVKGATGTARVETVSVQINGTQVGSVATASSTAAQTAIKGFTVMYMNGGWRFVGSNSTSGTTANDVADLAEYIHYTGEAPEAGDLLTVGDDSAFPSAKKSVSAYDNKLIGVVTTSPAETYSNNDDNHSVPMVLTGRAPVKVSLENGPIQAGDYLTASSTPGVAMRATAAGRMIGTALTSYSGGGDGKVMVQIQTGYAIPVNGAGDQLQGGAAPAGAAEFQGDIDAVNTRVDGLNSKVDDIDAALQGLQTKFDDLGGHLNTTTLRAGTLTVTGNATVKGNLTVGGLAKLKTLEVSGHFSLTGTDAPTLELQKGAGVDEDGKLNGVVTIAGNDNAGTITIVTGDSPTDDIFALIQFHDTFGNAPQMVVSPVGRDSAKLQFYADAISKDGFSLGSAVSPQAHTTYRVTYHAF